MTILISLYKMLSNLLNWWTYLSATPMIYRNRFECTARKLYQHDCFQRLLIMIGILKKFTKQWNVMSTLFTYRKTTNSWTENPFGIKTTLMITHKTHFQSKTQLTRPHELLLQTKPVCTLFQRHNNENTEVTAHENSTFDSKHSKESRQKSTEHNTNSSQ